MQVKHIGVIANCEKPRSPDVLRRLSASAEKLGLNVLAQDPAATLLGCRPMSLDNMLERAEAVIALGGDGTMLRAVRELDGRDIPVMGVNIGGLGFLTSVAEDRLDEALARLADGRFQFSARAVARCDVRRKDAGRPSGSWRALNDVVVARGASNRVITLDVSVDGEHVASYMCDGIVVATPTGSTGHSLSAGGPILSPETPAFVISVICPHTLSSRPVVVPDRSLIEIAGAEGPGDLRLSVDGQIEEPLAYGDVVAVRHSGHDARFIHLPGHSYFGVLRQKLGWSGSSVEPRTIADS